MVLPPGLNLGRNGATPSSMLKLVYVSRSQGGGLQPGPVSSKWWTLLASTIVLFNLYPLAVATIPEGDALVQTVYLWGVQDSFTTWLPGSDPCVGTAWEGVVCNALGHVTQLNLTNKGLKGPVPAAISSLSSLNTLDLSNAKFLNGSWNEIDGNLSALLSISKLQHLNLSYSYLAGGLPFPQELLGLSSLVTLRMDHASFTGQFPSEISNLRNLQYLYLGNNSMSGPLPKSLGLLENLLELSLWGNNFDSQIPPDLQYCKKLTYLNLHNCGLWAGLPAEFGNLKFMQRLILYRNDLTGPIPDRWQNMDKLIQLRLDQNFLFSTFGAWILQHPSLDSVFLGSNYLHGSFPNVTRQHNISILSLDCNYLSGPEPKLSYISISNNCFDVAKTYIVCSRNDTCEAFQQKIANGSCPACPPSQVIFDDNMCICYKIGSASEASKMGVRLGAIVGISLGAFAMLLLIFLVAIRRYTKRLMPQDLSGVTSPFDTEQRSLIKSHWEAPTGVQRFTFRDLEKATSGFSKEHEVGAGGFGKVFFGCFPDGRTLAVKRASGTGSQGITEFRNEISLLSRLHHKNLVRLEGFCEDNQILVYEYMKLGNLHNHLFKRSKSQELSWYKRLDIATGIARALEYLHTNADPPVIHRDVKPANILLDDSMTAKVADFGISRASSLLATHVSTDPVGTAGYFDPQYFLSHQLTTASDVYSFGVVLLELVTGQRAIDHNREEINLMTWAKAKLRRDGIASILDPRLKDDYPPDTFFDMADLALQCTAYEKDDRPTMRAILAILEPLLEAHKVPVSSTHQRSTSWESSDEIQTPPDWSMMSSDLRSESHTSPPTIEMAR